MAADARGVLADAVECMASMDFGVTVDFADLLSLGKALARNGFDMRFSAPARITDARKHRSCHCVCDSIRVTKSPA